GGEGGGRGCNRVGDAGGHGRRRPPLRIRGVRRAYLAVSDPPGAPRRVGTNAQERSPCLRRSLCSVSAPALARPSLDATHEKTMTLFSWLAARSGLICWPTTSRAPVQPRTPSPAPPPPPPPPP